MSKEALQEKTPLELQELIKELESEREYLEDSLHAQLIEEVQYDLYLLELEDKEWDITQVLQVTK